MNNLQKHFENIVQLLLKYFDKIVYYCTIYLQYCFNIAHILPGSSGAGEPPRPSVSRGSPAAPPSSAGCRPAPAAAAPDPGPGPGGQTTGVIQAPPAAPAPVPRRPPAPSASARAAGLICTTCHWHTCMPECAAFSASLARADWRTRCTAAGGVTVGPGPRQVKYI
jgi:hypothetical protein